MSSEMRSCCLSRRSVGTAMLTVRAIAAPSDKLGTPSAGFEGIAWFQDRMAILIDVHAAAHCRGWREPVNAEADGALRPVRH